MRKLRQQAEPRSQTFASLIRPFKAMPWIMAAEPPATAGGSVLNQTITST